MKRESSPDNSEELGRLTEKERLETQDSQQSEDSSTTASSILTSQINTLTVNNNSNSSIGNEPSQFTSNPALTSNLSSLLKPKTTRNIPSGSPIPKGFEVRFHPYGR